MELKGKICLITGATSGIGKETAKELAAHGADLVLPVRDIMKGESLKAEILEKSPNAQIEIMPCDLASFDSIRSFVDEFKARYDHLHILINNAGLWELKKKLSKDGIEMTFAVNHLAPFLLTNLLLETIKSSSPARIINVSSESHRRGTINFKDLEFSRRYSGIKAYGQSKLANILFTKKLSHLLKGSGITANCLHPGFVNTSIFDTLPRPVFWFMRPFMTTPRKGAETTIYLATSDEAANFRGEYFVDSKPKKPNKEALRKDIADRLWEISADYVGL
jgi:NAD(P)-dependent dehydrogenase (short-subunit alcohol dehydrogenase family)